MPRISQFYGVAIYIGEAAMTTLGPRIGVCRVEHLQGFRVLVTFANDTQREIDLEPFLHGPIFESIRRNASMFGAMRIEGGTIAWDNGADIDPDVLYYNLQPAWMEEAEAVSSVPDPAWGTQT